MKSINRDLDVFFASNSETNRPETRIMEDFKEIWSVKQTPLTEGLDTGMYELHAVVTHLGNSV